MQAKDPALPKIEDVALAAGVSTATVSRVLNKPGSVREPLRTRVIETVTRLGYVPHAGARALKLQRSGTVGAIFPTIDNAIFAKAIDALQQRLAEGGLQLLIATSGYDPDAEARQAMNLVTCGADALVLCGVGQRPALLQFLHQRELPTVHAMTYPPPPGLVCVGFDNARAIGQAVRYLLDLGHRRIAMLAGVTRDNDRATARVAGVRLALKKAGLTLAPQYLVERRYGLAEAREGLRTLMATKPAPTAVLCGNDVLAFGALLEAQALGIAVPAALSIVGFDDLEMARHLHPALTTLHVPTQAMWHAVADRLMAALAQRPVAPATEVEVKLVVRDSTGPAPRK
jgi:LacI family transcriptional regulator